MLGYASLLRDARHGRFPKRFLNLGSGSSSSGQENEPPGEESRFGTIYVDDLSNDLIGFGYTESSIQQPPTDRRIEQNNMARTIAIDLFDCFRDRREFKDQQPSLQAVTASGLISVGKPISLLTYEIC